MANRYPKVVIISGLSGSGKSTLVRNLAELLKYEKMDGGIIARKMAREKKMEIDKFSEYRIEHPETDFEIDRRLISFAEECKGAVIQSRVLAYFKEIQALPAIKIFMKAEAHERARRVAHREHIPVEKAQEIVQKTDQADRARFKKIYSIDISDHSVYDLIVDSTHIDAKHLALLVLDKIKLNKA